MSFAGTVVSILLILTLIWNFSVPSDIASYLERIAEAMEAQVSLDAEKAGLPDPYQEEE